MMSDFFGTGLNQSPRNFELGEAAYWDLDQLKQIILVDTNVDLSDIKQSIENTNQNVTNLDNTTLKKSANLNDLTNKATARNNLGLGDAATKNVGENAGNVMEVGAFGLGGMGVANNNLEYRSYLAHFDHNTLPTNYPAGEYRYGAMLSIAHGYNGTNMDMVFTHTPNSKILYRYSRNAPWREIYHSGNFNPDSKVNTGKLVEWSGDLYETGSIGTANNPAGTVTMPPGYVMTGLRTTGAGTWYSIHARGHRVGV